MRLPLLVLPATAFLLSPLGPDAARAECIDWGSHLRWVGHAATPAYAFSVAVAGTFACVADSSGSLMIVDISDPGNPGIVGGLNYPNTPLDVAVQGHYAYVASGANDMSRGLTVVDISDPTAPVVTGGATTPSKARCVAVDGSHAYVVGLLTGIVAQLHVVDVSDPALPVIISTIDVPGTAYGIAVAGDYAYVTADYAGLHVIDISDPTMPVIVGNIDPEWYSYNVTVSGDRAYLVGRRSTARLWVVDISVPHAPAILGTVDMPGEWGAYDVAVSGRFAFVARSVEGLQIVDVLDPASPSVVGSLDTPHWASGVAIAGGHVVVADRGSGLWIANAVNPFPPEPTGHVNAPEFAEDVAVQEHFAYVTDNDYGQWRLQVVDMFDPTSPDIVGFVTTTGTAIDVDVEGAYAYALARTDHSTTGSSLRIADISDPTSPVFVGSEVVPRPAGLAVSGGFAYVTSRLSSAELVVLDVREPTIPPTVATLDIPSSYEASGIHVSGNHAYVGNISPWKLAVVDISVPESPALLANVPTAVSPTAIAMSGQYAYVAGVDGLQVVDVSDPLAPVPGVHVPLDDYASGIAISGRYAYVSVYEAGVQVLDLIDPARPVALGGANLPGVTLDVAVAGERVVLADGEEGVWLYPAQCDDPVPVLLSGFTGAAVGRTVELTWRTSFEDRFDGFHVYRSQSLESGWSRRTGDLVRGRSPYTWVDRSVEPDRVWYYRLGAVDRDGREVPHPPISVITPAWELRTMLALASPNPFREKTTVRLVLAEPARARLAVYDVTGRRVRVLVDAPLPEGDHAAVWDGRDEAGRRVGGGTYFVRLEGGGVESAVKVVLLGDS